jgi:multidrug efflux pump
VPSLAGLFSSFQVSVPQIDVNVDRERVKSYGVPLTDVFETLQVYLGSLYVNDFNRFGRTYQVNAQAESGFRCSRSRSGACRRETDHGAMVPLGSLVKVTRSYGPDQVMHYNGYPAAEINGGPAPGFSSGQAQAAIADVLERTAAARHVVRVDRAGVSGAARRQHHALHLSAVRAARLHRAGGSL